MGAVRTRVQTADKNIAIIHTTPVHQLTSITDYGLIFWTEEMVLNLNVLMELFNTNMQLFTSLDVNWGTGVVWITCDVFISCLNTHSDGTHSLQKIHWWASDIMRSFSKSVLIKKQTHLHLDGLRAGTCRGGGGGCLSTCPLAPWCAQSALLSRQFLLFFLFFIIKHPSVKACPM